MKGGFSGHYYHNQVVIIIMALVINGKLPHIVRSHAYRPRMSAYDVTEEDFYEGSSDSSYPLTSYDDDTAYMTKCQNRRRQEKTFNVSCLEDGSFNDTQCHMETMECWCVDDGGDFIQGSIKKLPELPRCTEKVRPTFTVTFVTPSRKPESVVGRQLVGNPSSNESQPLHTKPSEDTITNRNQLANHSWNKQYETDDDDGGGGNDYDYDDDNGGGGGDNDGTVTNDDEDEDGGTDDEGGDVDDDDYAMKDVDHGQVFSKNSNQLLRRDPVYTTGLILIVLLSSSIIIIVVIFFVHRLKRKDEGSYTLASNAVISTIGYSMTKDTEYFA